MHGQLSPVGKRIYLPTFSPPIAYSLADRYFVRIQGVPNSSPVFVVTKAILQGPFDLSYHDTFYDPIPNPKVV